MVRSETPAPGPAEASNNPLQESVSYNESRVPFGAGTDTRTGSHNVVVGQGLNFSSFGGLEVGQFNEISGQFASVSGGNSNTDQRGHLNRELRF